MRKQRMCAFRTQRYIIHFTYSPFLFTTKQELVHPRVISFTWKRLPGRWAGLAGFPVCKQWGSFWWWRSTWQAGWTDRATLDQTPRWRRRNPAFSPWLMDRSSPGSCQPPGTQCQMGSTWRGKESLKSQQQWLWSLIQVTQLTYRQVSKTASLNVHSDDG